MIGMADTMVQPDNEHDISPRNQGVEPPLRAGVHEEEAVTIGR